MVATVVSYGGFYLVDSPTWNETTPMGQVSFQFAGTNENAAEIVAAWEAEGVVHLAGTSLGFDYLFMTVYGVTLALGGALVASRAGGGAWSTPGALAAWAGVTAAVLDGVENALLLGILGDPATGSPGAVASIAFAKFTLILAAAAVVIAGGLATRGRGA